MVFDVKRYREYGEGDVFDEAVREPGDFPVYESGNYATLSKPGYYMVMTAPEAAAPTMFTIQVLEEGDGAPLIDDEGDAAESEEIWAVPTSAKVLVNGEAVAFGAYQINGNSYFKLRDVGKAMNFGITWDGSANRIGIDSESSYTE